MASTFKSNDTSISEILKNIDRGINQLPDFQRGWVWDDDRIRALIASITNSYPVGALMFLEYGGDSVRFKYRTFTGSAARAVPEILVLDGQQRLTSIYTAMFCKAPVPTQTSKKEKNMRFYYLDIRLCLTSTADREDAIVSMPSDKIKRKDYFAREIELDLSTKEKEFENHHFPLNIVYDPIAAQMWMNDYQKYHNYDPEILQQYARFTADVLMPIQAYKVPVITLNKDTPKEAVCQVFENVNTGGVSLTVFELVTASFAADNYPLRDDWYGSENDDGEREQGRYDYMVSKNKLLSVVSDVDFLVAVTLLTRYNLKQKNDDAPAVSCKKQDVLKLDLSDYLKHKDELTEGFIAAANFIGEQRIFNPRDLPYTTQFIPFSVLLTILKNKASNGTVRDKLSRWFWCGILGEMYGGANETRYANDVTGVISWLNGGEEPDTIARANFHSIRLLSLQSRLSAAYKGVMALILKSRAQDFISGKEMDFTAFLDENIDIHHVFPRHYCEEQRIDKRKWNAIVNKTPLSSGTNRIIGGNAPSVYLKKIEIDGRVANDALDNFVSTHLISAVHMRADCFDDFFIERAKALLVLISNAMGKPASGLSGDDIVREFGSELI